MRVELLTVLAALVACQARSGDPVERAAAWMAAFPPDRLRFDAAIGLSAIRAVHDGDALRSAEVHARQIADRDADNPLRRAFDDRARVPAAASAGWPIPGPGERVNVNRIVGEALHCRDNGLRPEAIAYATGAMRDRGGYQTTHALWALAIAKSRGCLPDFEARARPLIDELRAAEPATPEPGVLALDLYAERVLMLELAGDRDVAPWLRALAAAQNADGSWGVLAPDEDPYHQFHATLVAAWALALQKM